MKFKNRVKLSTTKKQRKMTEDNLKGIVMLVVYKKHNNLFYIHVQKDIRIYGQVIK